MSTGPGRTDTRPRSTRAELIGTIAAVIAIPAAIVTVLAYFNSTGPSAGPPVSQPADVGPDTAPSPGNSSDSNGPEAGPSLDPPPSAGAGIEPAHPTVAPADDPAPATGNPTRGDAAAAPPPPPPPPPPSSYSRPLPSLAEQAAFIPGYWRLSDETCLRRQKFSIEGEFISVAAGLDVIGSYTIKRVERGVIILTNGARYTYDGETLSYVEGGQTVRTYRPC